MLSIRKSPLVFLWNYGVTKTNMEKSENWILTMNQVIFGNFRAKHIKKQILIYNMKKTYFDDPHLNEATLRCWEAMEKTTKKNNPFKGMTTLQILRKIRKN